jgi:hypothetical protein
MSGRKHEEKNCIAAVCECGAVIKGGIIYIPPEHSFGNGSLGKLDYLVNHKKYKAVFLSEAEMPFLKKIMKEAGNARFDD